MYICFHDLFFVGCLGWQENEQEDISQYDPMTGKKITKAGQLNLALSKNSRVLPIVGFYKPIEGIRWDSKQHTCRTGLQAGFWCSGRWAAAPTTNGWDEWDGNGWASSQTATMGAPSILRRKDEQRSIHRHVIKSIFDMYWIFIYI